MAQDVVINGTTYPAVETVALTDANGNTTMYYPDAVRYVPQELTNEQKIQARENIGITEEMLKNGQLEIEFVDSIEECTDISKAYVLPDGFIYLYREVTTSTGPSYTNILPLAINADGTEYVGDNGEDGYRVGYRVNSSGNEVEESKCCVTGFLPAVDGDVIRVKGFTRGDTANIVHHYKSDFTKYGSPIYPSSWTDEGNGIYSFKVGITTTNTTQYIRIAVATISSDAVVTRNEEIDEGGSTTGYAWVNTGRAFVPADYEDRIVALETTTTKQAVRVNALEKAIKSGSVDNTEAEALTRVKTWDKPVYDSAPVTLIADGAEKPALTENNRTIAAIYAKYRALAAAYPRYITETNLGPCTGSDTFDAVDMLRFDFKESDGLTNADYNSANLHETKPKIIFMSGVHTEWVGIWGLYYALEEITTNPAFDDIRRNAHIIVVPCGNPFCLSGQTVDGWRTSHVNANGVAIHNNFNVDHSTSGSVGEYNYGGATPCSELETQYIDKIMADNPDAVAFVSCHNNDYSTEFGTPVIWASSATYHMCNITFRLIDKLSKAWCNKYGDSLISTIDTIRADFPALNEGDYRLGRAMMSDSKGTEQKNALKYGIQGVNLEIARIMKVFSGDVDGTSEVMTHGAEVYANFIRTLLSTYDYKDKKDYAANLPWSD